MNRICFLLLVCFLSSCLSGEEREAQKQIREQYKAEEVRIHFPDDDSDAPNGMIVEIIIINSPALGASRAAFEEGLSIAQRFYKAMKKKETFLGVRLIISNPSIGNHVSGFSKSYFYGKNLLEH